ncbi:thiol-disulfide oxidoreductase DCC family protein [Thalassotalea fusca]
MLAPEYPPLMTKNDCVILFDGKCKLCNAWSQFIIKYDKQDAFKLCSVQSSEGQDILKYFNMPVDHFDTMLYVVGNQPFDKSDAFLEVVNKLGFPWRLLRIFKLLPKKIRNWLYDRIALNRYFLFGQYETCMMPSPENQRKFLSSNR